MITEIPAWTDLPRPGPARPGQSLNKRKLSDSRRRFLDNARPIVNEKVSYRKQIACQHSRHKILARAGGVVTLKMFILPFRYLPIGRLNSSSPFAP